jgi:predicted aconitase with swiveling domain
MPVAAAPATEITSAPPISSDGTVEERISRLEQSVGALRSDYARIMPAFASLNTTNERIQTLLDEMEADGKIPPVAAAKRPEPVPTVAAPLAAMKVQPSEEEMAADAIPPQTVAPAAAPSSAEPPPAAGLANTVKAVRIGEHGNKTRLVFDLTTTTKPEFSYDLDNGEKLLMVEMPGSAWDGKDSGQPNSPMIAGWNAQKGSTGGSTVVVQLKQNARILSTEFLKAEGGDPSRLVMDIASGG